MHTVCCIYVTWSLASECQKVSAVMYGVVRPSIWVLTTAPMMHGTSTTDLSDLRLSFPDTDMDRCAANLMVPYAMKKLWRWRCGCSKVPRHSDKVLRQFILQRHLQQRSAVQQPRPRASSGAQLRAQE
jgi:hypothetical protein